MAKKAKAKKSIKRKSLTHDRLKELLNYCPDTEWWMALIKRKQLNIGDRAGSLGCQGYWRLKVDGRSYLSSRLAVFYMTGEWPLSEIDHKDLDHANDRWNNLRPATHSQNIANQTC